MELQKKKKKSALISSLILLDFHVCLASQLGNEEGGNNPYQNVLALPVLAKVQSFLLGRQCSTCFAASVYFQGSEVINFSCASISVFVGEVLLGSQRSLLCHSGSPISFPNFFHYSQVVSPLCKLKSLCANQRKAVRTLITLNL